MEMQKIKNTLHGLLITGLLVGTAQDVLAQRTVIRGERRSDEKRSARTNLKKDKIVKQSGKKTVGKNHTPKSDRTKARYSKNEHLNKDHRDFRKDDKSNKRDKKTCL